MTPIAGLAARSDVDRARLVIPAPRSQPHFSLPMV